MTVFYIITNNGFLKLYYSEPDISGNANKESTAKFSASLRNARSFDSIEEAKNILNEKSIKDCLIVNQNGIKQIY